MQAMERITELWAELRLRRRRRCGWSHRERRGPGRRGRGHGASRSPASSWPCCSSVELQHAGQLIGSSALVGKAQPQSPRALGRKSPASNRANWGRIDAIDPSPVDDLRVVCATPGRDPATEVGDFAGCLLDLQCDFEPQDAAFARAGAEVPVDFLDRAIEDAMKTCGLRQLGQGNVEGERRGPGPAAGRDCLLAG